MNKILLFFFPLLLYSCGSGLSSNPTDIKEEKHSSSDTKKGSGTDLKNGDIVFQNSQSGQCKAIELATHSKYTHCGILFLKDNTWQVLEAVQPVTYTPLDRWIERGLNNHYVVKRMKDRSALSDSVLIAMQKEGEKYLGKDYDIYFGWGNDQIYCSELVWKIYKDVSGIEAGQLHRLNDFDLTSQEVKTIMKKRYGSNIPYNEQVISPSNIFESPLLETIRE